MEEGEAGGDDVLGGETEPEAAEEAGAGGAGGGGHGLEVGPGGLLHEAVADGDLGGGPAAGGGGVDSAAGAGRGGGKEVLEGGVGERGLEGDELLQVEGRRREDAVLDGEAGALAGLGRGGGERERLLDHHRRRQRVAAAADPRWVGVVGVAHGFVWLFGSWTVAELEQKSR